MESSGNDLLVASKDFGRETGPESESAWDTKKSSDRSGKELLVASKKYAQEIRSKSWFHLVSTLIIFAILFGITVSSLPWYVCLPASLVLGMVMVRMFILYHDHQHGAILRNSKIANCLMFAYGMLVLSPPELWRHTHDDHHKNNCKTFGAALGSFPVMTTDTYATATFGKRLGYRIIRNPLIILFGYLTSFFWNKSLKNFLTNPVRNFTAGLAIVLHTTLLVLVGMYSISALFYGLLIPLFIGSAVGTYLFYAQHNFPGMKRKDGQEWDYVYAALQSSSFMKMSKVMHWFTGNIGYHHVHHLNAKIPFYRLPEAMAGMRELQDPIATSLSPKDVLHCLRLKLWDPVEERLLTFREARMLQRSMPTT